MNNCEASAKRTPLPTSSASGLSLYSTNDDDVYHSCTKEQTLLFQFQFPYPQPMKTSTLG